MKNMFSLYSFFAVASLLFVGNGFASKVFVKEYEYRMRHAAEVALENIEKMGNIDKDYAFVIKDTREAVRLQAKKGDRWILFSQCFDTKEIDNLKGLFSQLVKQKKMDFQFCFGDIQQKTLLFDLTQHGILQGFCEMMRSFQSMRKIVLEDVDIRSNGDNTQNLEKIIQDLSEDMAVVSENLLAKLEVADSVQKKDVLKDVLLIALQCHLIDLTFNEDPTSLRKMIKLSFNKFNPYESSMDSNAYNSFSEPMKLFYRQEYCQSMKMYELIVGFLYSYCSSTVAIEAFDEFLKIPVEKKIMKKQYQKLIEFSKNHSSGEAQSIYFASLSIEYVLERFFDAADKAIMTARVNKPKLDINSTENILISEKN